MVFIDTYEKEKLTFIFKNPQNETDVLMFLNKSLNMTVICDFIDKFDYLKFCNQNIVNRFLTIGT